MAIRLKDVKGLMIEKRETLIGPFVREDEMFNKALDLQGSKEIGLCRDKLNILDEVIQKVLNKEFSLDVTPYEVICMRNSIADKLISKQHNLIEFKGRAE